MGGTSNPNSHIVWTLDEEDITGKATEQYPPGEHNARSVESTLVLTVTRETNEQKLRCDLLYNNNEVANDDMTLNVTCE